MQDLVSVCIPTYNGAQFLREALDSLKNQTYSNIEVIISDDDSKDNTLQIVEEFKERFDKPIYIYNHSPNGIGANWNYSIEKANGEYIKFLFQDDILLPTCIEDMVKVLKKDPTIGLVASKRDFIVEEPNEETNIWIKTYGDLQAGLYSKDDLFILTKKIFKTSFFSKSPPNKIGEPSVVMFRKELFDSIGKFNEELEQILDYEYWYRILKQKNIAVINRPLVKFRIHPEQATNKNKNKKIVDYELWDYILYKEFFWFLSLKDQVKLFGRYTLLGKVLKKIYNIFG
ncbi:MAG: glycosyltransferase family 2 protein [Flavobacteriales bacterium]